MKRLLKSIIAAAALVVLSTGTIAAQAAPTGGSGGPLTNRLNQSFTANSITSTYHVFASGLDWTKEVGLLMYTDGSGAYGLKNPNSTYLLDADGTDGLVAMAKKHNLLLVTPFAPAPDCADGSGDNCWYNESGSPSAAAKAAWSSALMTYIKGQYNLENNRVVVGGYSSGAQWTTRWFMPAHGEAQSVDLAVAISYGGAPYVTPSFSAAYKASTVVSFDTGTADEAYSTAAYGAIGGYNWYTNAGFDTDATWPSGVGHARDGQFDVIMDREITQHLAAAGTPTTPPAPAPWATTVSPTKTGGTFTISVPSGYGPGSVYVRLSSGNYLYQTNVTGPAQVSLTFKAQACGTALTYTVEAPDGTARKTGSFSTLPC